MLTEKLFRDWSWCPRLLGNPEGAEKRRLPDRSSDEATTDTLGALRDLLPNKRVLVTRVDAATWRGESYEPGKDLWVVVATPVEPLLLVVHSWTRHYDGSRWVTTATLTRDRRFFDDRDEQIEVFLRRALWRVVHGWFPWDRARVETVVEGNESDPSVTEMCSPRDLDALDRWIREIVRGFDEDEAAWRPQLAKCPSCRWVDCPSRVIPTLPPKNPQGRHEGVW
jgi:hypothetical protein